MNKIIGLLLVTLMISQVSSQEVQNEVNSSGVQVDAQIEVSQQEVQIEGSWRGNGLFSSAESIQFSGKVKEQNNGLLKIDVNFSKGKSVGRRSNILEGYNLEYQGKLIIDVIRYGRSGQISLEERNSLVPQIIEKIRFS